MLYTHTYIICAMVCMHAAHTCTHIHKEKKREILKRKELLEITNLKLTKHQDNRSMQRASYRGRGKYGHYSPPSSR